MADDSAHCTHLLEMAVCGMCPCSCWSTQSISQGCFCQNCQKYFCFHVNALQYGALRHNRSSCLQCAIFASNVHGLAAKSLAAAAISSSAISLSHISVEVDCFCCVLMQRGVYDWCALSLGLAASVRPASDTLTSGRPPQVLCTLKNYTLLVLTMVLSFAMYWGCLAWLTTRPWFRNGNGTSFEVR